MCRVAPPPPPPHPLWMRMPIAATDAIARIYFLTVTYLRQSESAKARASRIVAVLPAIIPTMLLNNKPLSRRIICRYHWAGRVGASGLARPTPFGPTRRVIARAALAGFRSLKFRRAVLNLAIQLDFCASLWYVGSSDIKGARLKLVCIRSFR